AAAKIPGLISGSVTSQTTVDGLAPSEAAASSTDMLTPSSDARSRRIHQGIVSRTWPATNTGVEPTIGAPDAISISTTVTYSAAPITIAGTVRGDIKSWIKALRPRKLRRTITIAAGTETSSPASIAKLATAMESRNPLRN